MFIFSLFSLPEYGYKCVKTDTGEYRIIKMQISGKSVGMFERRCGEIKTLAFYTLDGKKDESTKIGFSPFCVPHSPLTYKKGETIKEKTFTKDDGGIYYVSSFDEAIFAANYF